ncbi:MAG: hypothetical protein HDS45_02470 [Bacteroides sp.]|nr:hypothetical protein [Bacteroides sp.]MDE7462960.1 hypothetical protein [Muribaculaceae bacterium]
MTAKDAISLHNNSDTLPALKSVDAGMPLLEVLPHLLDAPGRVLSVDEEGETIGLIDESSLLEGMSRLIATRDDSSVLTIECSPEQYSASAIAHAVEDADVHLVDLLSRAAEGGKLRVNLRVRVADPEGVARSLERYGYRVIDRSGGTSAGDAILAERLASLQALLNV